MIQTMTKTMKIAFQGEPGANSHIAIAEAYPDAEAAALPDLRGRAGRDLLGRGRPRHDPDRELGRRPRRRHPSSAAAIRPVHRRRMVPAGPSSVDGAARRQTRRHQDRRKPRPRARAMPPHHPQARHQADRVGRYRRQRAHRRRARRQELRLDRLEAGGRNLRPRYPGRGRRGRDPQHHALRGAGARGQLGQTGIGAAGHHLCFPGAQPPRRALQGDGRLCHQRRQHDQARKLHGRRQFLRHAILCRCRRPSRRQGTSPLRWRN